jgi:hypothetical protein
MIIASNIEKSRKSLVRLIKAYEEQESENNDIKFRNLMTAFNTLHSYWKTIKEEELEKRLNALEERIGQ